MALINANAKRLQLMSIDCDTVEADHNKGQVNEHSK